MKNYMFVLSRRRKQTKIQQYFDFVPPEENENEQYEDKGTIEESINDDGAVDNNGADNDDNDSTSEILRPSNQEIQTTSSNSCHRSRNKWTKEELNALEAGMEKYKTNQLKDKAHNEKFHRSRIGIEIGVFNHATSTRDPSQGQ
ncbi:hypothetical protein C2G38_2321119 [Gigaspora rosea]|uniref:Uncharacterized protein n=1 Tax=Gigaspora rosea TaxID=44941 RepID=A0A397UZ52_9GLOM|nr:hypothetical protein C2G38_2321119 [Gigaspora rosea]